MAAAGQSRPRLDALHRRLEQLRFLDPSCGCGNFLVVTYRELRLLEQEILERLFTHQRASGQTARMHSQAVLGGHLPYLATAA
ncbi:DNA methyltransferase [Hymenobacter antarcticus]|uniref:DNA methyltransferase n=1 Tax=Hymenobacter antarcticus TaxID=486270 RepID=UPI0031F0301E